MDKRTILISGPNTTFKLYEELSQHFEVAVYTRQIAEQLSIETGQPIVCPAGSVTPSLVDVARNESTLMAADVVVGLNSVPGVNGSVPDYGAWLPGLAMNQFGEAIVNIQTLDAWASETDLAGVVVHEDVTANYKTLALWAKAQGVPVIHVPHNNCYAQEVDIHNESVSDWILASSPYMQDWYVGRGFDENKIKMVGFGPWDHWADAKSLLDRDHARRVLHIDDDKPVVTFCSSWAQRTNFVDDHTGLERAMALILRAAKRKDWTLVWKLHPGEQQGAEQHYQNVLAAHRVRGLVTRAHLPYALAVADVVVSAGPSNVLVEAGLMDRPLALFDLRGYGFEGAPPWSIGESVDSAIETVDSLLDGKEWKKHKTAFLRRYAGKVDGKATKRTAKAIGKILTV